jgi:diamine N-acetyltransferase
MRSDEILHRVQNDRRFCVTMKLRLRPTLLDDLDYVLSLEHAAENLPFITPWERTQHDAAVRFPDFRHFIIEAGEEWSASPAAGFVILQGCRNPHKNLELKRIVIEKKGAGAGRACVKLLTRMAFEDFGAHRFWLDVKSNNARAKHIYATEGFREEGTLRECLKHGDEWLSLTVHAMLESEYRAQHKLSALLKKSHTL